ncbi:serine dehydratase subunit alpha family protein [Pelomyxa schiedti]|nr:serine dehydratase subunit alpha family protein [Pelomyxa schiedti]
MATTAPPPTSSASDPQELTFSEYLKQEWRPTLGCTEPASIAYGCSLASLAAGDGEVVDVTLLCDPRMYKNCYAVGIPHSQSKTGIQWAVAIGASFTHEAIRRNLKLECFSATDEAVLAHATFLMTHNRVHVTVRKDVEADTDLLVDCTVTRAPAVKGRCVITQHHTNVTLVARDGVPVNVDALLNGESPSPLSTTEPSGKEATPKRISIYDRLCKMSFTELFRLARSITPEDREMIRLGSECNLAICAEGMKGFRETLNPASSSDAYSRAAITVFHGVHARMCGTACKVYCLAGSGNKGITSSVPLNIVGRHLGIPQNLIEESLAMACLVTSLTTAHLGTLSAICGCNNAAGIGLAAGLVMMNNGGERELSLACNNMVGNVAGMICDGAKMGCALKAMTAVDAAFRAVHLAMSGIGIPSSDGIVGASGITSLVNLGKVACLGMRHMDEEILHIMEQKLADSELQGCTLHNHSSTTTTPHDS